MQLQLSVQQEEAKIFQSLPSRGQNALHPPHHLAQDQQDSLKILKSQLARQTEEAKAARSALHSELARQADELSTFQQQLRRHEEDKSMMIDEIQRLQNESISLRQQTPMPADSAAAPNRRDDTEFFSERREIIFDGPPRFFPAAPLPPRMDGGSQLQLQQHTAAAQFGDKEGYVKGSVNKTTMWSLLYDQ